MKIWHLQSKKGVDYDSYDAHVVVAYSPKKARALCPSGDEGKETWLNPEHSTCKCIGKGAMFGTANITTQEVVISSFNAG